MKARDIAAEEFKQHLTDSAHNDPDALHVVVAHSHGGTVAAKAILTSPPEKVRLGAMVCIATPFAYLVTPSDSRRQTALVALAALIYALYWTAILATFPSAINATPSMVLASVVAFKSVIAFAIVRAMAHPPKKNAQRGIQPRFPIYLLRATRDEATMILSVAQWVDWLCAGLARLHDPLEAKIGQPLSFFGYALMYSMCLVAGLEVITNISNSFGLAVAQSATAALALLVYGPAAAGVVYIVGVAVLAVAVGHHKVADWLSTAVEVDAAPPGIVCRLIIYSGFAEPQNKTLRHSLYEREEIIEEVAVIVNQVSKGDCE